MIEIKYNGVHLQADGETAKELWQMITNALMIANRKPLVQAREVKGTKKYNTVKHHTAKAWTQEEYDRLIERDTKLRAGGVSMRSKRVGILAKEFSHRTPLAIMARLMEHDKGKPFKVKTHWRLARKDFAPEPEEQTPQKEYLNAGNGEIEV